MLSALLTLALAGGSLAQSGRLEAGDTQLESGEYVDVHPYDAAAGSTLDIALTSSEFDVYLVVLGPDDAVLLEVDDAEGRGLDAHGTLPVEVGGRYLIAVTSARPGEVGEYRLTVTSVGGPAGAAAQAAPEAPADEQAADPLGVAALAQPAPEQPAQEQAAQGQAAQDQPAQDQAAQAQPAPEQPAPEQPAPQQAYVGTFTDGRLTVILRSGPSGYTGEIVLDGQTYSAAAAEIGGRLRGSFQSGGQEFPFEADLLADGLSLASGGATYDLARVGGPNAAPTNPLAVPGAGGAPAAPANAAAEQAPPVGPPEGAQSAAPAPATAEAAAPVVPQPRIAPQPGHVTGTVSDAQGRPIAGAGVLVRGATYASGERVSFEAQTGADGTYAIRVPHGRYEAKAWVDVAFEGQFFSLLLHPLSGNPNSQVDSEAGGSLDFQWRTRGLRAGSVPPGRGPDDFYGASVDLSYCGLPASAYCSAVYEAYDGRPIAAEGARVRVTLTPTGALVDGSAGVEIVREFAIQPRDDQYPYGGGIFPEYPNGGGGRTVLGADWDVHAMDLNDIPVGTYVMRVDAIHADGRVQPFRLGLTEDDVEHASVPVTFAPWEDYHARNYVGGGLAQTTVYVRD